MGITCNLSEIAAHRLRAYSAKKSIGGWCECGVALKKKKRQSSVEKKMCIAQREKKLLASYIKGAQPCG